MNFDLSDEQAAALERELTAIIDGDLYPLSPRIQVLRDIRNMIRPEPKPEPLPEPKRYEPPRRTIPQTRLDEIRTRPPDDARRCGGCRCSVHRLVSGMPIEASPLRRHLMPPKVARSDRSRCEAPDGAIAQMAERYGPRTPVPEWRERLVCSACGNHDVDMVVTGERR